MARASLKERKPINKGMVLLISYGVLLVLVILFASLYFSANDQAKIAKKMKIYDLSGTTNTITVGGINYKYNGTDNFIGDGLFTYTGKEKNITGYSYTLFSQEKGQPKEALLTATIISKEGQNLDLTTPVTINKTIFNDNKDSLLKAKDFPDKYSFSFQLVLTTNNGLVTEEVYLKTTEIDTTFFQK